MTRTLLLMRHAKAVVGTGPDRARPLAERGRRDALRMADVVQGLLGGATLDLAVVSSAVRTRETWDRLGQGGVSAAEMWPDSAVYLAANLLSTVQEIPGSVTTALLVGHSPTIPALGLDLATRPSSSISTEASDPAAYQRLAVGNFPTSSVLHLTLEGDWAETTPGSGALLAFVAPRDLG